MKTFKATYWRSNPQLKNGGYETTKTYEARTLASARKKANDYTKNTVYGGMTLLTVEEA